MDNNIKRSPKFTKALYKQKNPKYKNIIPKEQLSSNSLLIDNKEKAKDSNSKNDLIKKDIEKKELQKSKKKGKLEIVECTQNIYLLNAMNKIY